MSTLSRERGIIVILTGATVAALVWVLVADRSASWRTRVGVGSAASAAVSTDPEFDLGGLVTQPLSPGLAGPIDVRFTNSEAEPLTVTDVVVSVGAVIAPNATARRGCGSTDFIVEQGSFGEVLVPGGSSVRLSDAGRPASRWPRLRMRDAAVNQDGCQGATVRLDYRARGRVET